MAIDLSVVVTSHNEGFLLRPTMRSICAAADLAVAQGYKLEVIIMLDRADESTKKEANSYSPRKELPFGVRVIETSNGEPGSTRNAGIKAAKGKYVTVCDGDDLVSENFYCSALEVVLSHDDDVIVHPEIVLSFGDRRQKWHVVSSLESKLHFTELLNSNLWPSSSLAPKSLYTKHPYPKLTPGAGYGPEDYMWNIATASAGIHHVTARDTICFYRTRNKGGVNNAHMGSILPAFSIFDLEQNFPLPVVEPRATGRKAEPKQSTPRAHALLARSYRTTKKLLGPLLRMTPHEWKRAIYRGLRHSYARISGRPFNDQGAAGWNESLRRIMSVACDIEPAISWTAMEFDRLPVWTPPSDGFGKNLAALIKLLEGRSEVLIFAPWIGIGGADLVTVNYAHALAGNPAVKNRITAITTYLPEKTLTDQIPAGVQHVQVPTQFRFMTPDRQNRLLAQLVELSGPKLVISINCFDFSNALSEYGPQMSAHGEVYVSMFAWDRIGPDGYPVNAISDDPQRTYLRDITGVITDNSVTAQLIQDRLGIDAALVRVHRQPALNTIPSFKQITKSAPSYLDGEFDADNPFRVVWPHRLDKEKRPDSLLEIALSINEKNLPIEFHVHGSAVFTGKDDGTLSDLKRHGVVYHGPYSGGLPALPIENYHALLLTSESEGLPLVLVQALLLGLPVVASDVGGVSDIITDGTTGLLAKGPDDINGFVSALESLMRSVDLRRRLLKHGYEFAVGRHSSASFREQLEGDFQSPLQEMGRLRS